MTKQQSQLFSWTAYRSVRPVSKFLLTYNFRENPVTEENKRNRNPKCVKNKEMLVNLLQKLLSTICTLQLGGILILYLEKKKYH